VPNGNVDRLYTGFVIGRALTFLAQLEKDWKELLQLNLLNFSSANQRLKSPRPQNQEIPLLVIPRG